MQRYFLQSFPRTIILIDSEEVFNDAQLNGSDINLSLFTINFIYKLLPRKRGKRLSDTLKFCIQEDTNSIFSV